MSGNVKVRVVNMPEDSGRGVRVTEPFFTLDGNIVPQGGPTSSDIENMLRIDGEARALELAITLPIIRNSFKIVPEVGDKGEADYVRDMISGGGGIDMTQTIGHMTGAFARRVCYFEKVWTKDGNKHVIESLVPLSAASCVTRVNRNGRYNGFVQSGTRSDGSPFSEYFSPEESFVYYHDFVSRPMVGRSVFETAYYDFLDKQRIKRLYFYHIQNVSLGRTFTRYSGTDHSGASKLARKVANVRGGGVISLGEGEEVERFDSSKSATDFKEGLDWLNAQMATSLLAGFLNLGQRGDSGSWALSRDHKDFFLQSVEGRQSEIESSFQKHVVNKAVDFNFTDPHYPKFVFEGLSDTERTRALETWLTVIGGGGSQVVEPEVIQAMQANALPLVGVDMESLRSERNKSGKNVPEVVQRLSEEPTGLPDEGSNLLGG